MSLSSTLTRLYEETERHGCVLESVEISTTCDTHATRQLTGHTSIITAGMSTDWEISFLSAYPEKLTDLLTAWPFEYLGFHTTLARRLQSLGEVVREKTSGPLDHDALLKALPIVVFSITLTGTFLEPRDG